MPAPDELLRLIETFDRNLDAYRAGSYNEAQLRQEFLNPFFTALGWDVNNTRGYAEAYKDVIHEDAIKIGAATKAPSSKRSSLIKSPPPTSRSTASSINSTT